MSFKKSFFQHDISPLQLRLLSILDDWGRTDASWTHIINEMKRRKFYKRMPPLEKIKGDLNKLIDVELIKTKEYRDGTIHYILGEYFYK